MKKAEIKDLLKKDLLVVELQEGVDYGISKNLLYFYDHDTTQTYSIEGSYTRLGKPKEIREEDARELVDRIGDGDPCYQGDWFENYQDDESMFETATESLLSLLETEIFWDVNPYGTRESNTLTEGGHEIWAYSDEHYSKWREAEQKTFDRNRSIILVKQ